MACRHIFKNYRIIGPTIQRHLSVSTQLLNAEKDVGPTHTGQVYDKDDYRNVRFINSKRYVNANWAIELIDEIPPKKCTERVVYCDGGDANLGHPKVYINLDKPGPQTCGYCGLRFVKSDHGHH